MNLKQSQKDPESFSPGDVGAIEGEPGGAREALTPEQRLAVLQAELDRARSREDFLRMQIEETRNKAGQAFAFQVELAQQQEATLEAFHEKEKSLVSQLESARKEAGRVGELTVQLDGQKAELERLIHEKDELVHHLEEAHVETTLAQSYQADARENLARFQESKKREQSLQEELAAAKKFEDLARVLEGRLARQRAELKMGHSSRVWARKLQEELEQQHFELLVSKEREKTLSNRLESAEYQFKLVEALQGELIAQRTEIEEMRVREETYSAGFAASREAGPSEKLQEELAGYRDSMDALREREHNLVFELENARVLAAQSEKLRAELIAQRTAVEALRQRESALVAELEAANARATRAESLQKQIERQQASIAAESGREKGLLSELEAARSQALLSENLRTQIASQLVEMEAIREREASLVAELESARSAGAENRKLRDDLVKVRAEAEALRSQEQALQRELEAAQARLGLVDQLQHELSEQKLAVAGLRVREAELMRELEAAQNEGRRVETLNQDLSNQRTALQALQEREKSLLADLENARAQGRDAEALRQEIAARRMDLEALRQKENSLATELDSARREATLVQSLRAEIAAQSESLLKLRDSEKLLGSQLEEARSEAALAASLKVRLVSHERTLEEFRSSEASLRSRIAEIEAESARTLKESLDRYRSELEEARQQNQKLARQLDGASRSLEESRSGRPGSRKTMVFASVALACALALLAVQLYPKKSTEDSVRKNADLLDKLKEQNTQLAGQLNDTLLRLQTAKDTELTLDRNRGLAERLDAAEAKSLELERDQPVKLALITQLQSDLDLANDKISKLFTELSSRDMKILELEKLLGEAGSQAFQLTLPPPLSLNEVAPVFLHNADPAPVLSPSALPTGESLQTLQARAEKEFQAKNFEGAGRLYQEVADAAPTNSLAWSNLAAVQMELGKLNLAEQSIRNAIAISPDDAFSHTTLGIILLKSGQVDPAMKSLLKAIYLDPSDPAAFNYLGVAFDQKGDRGRAIQEIEKALKLSPAYGEAHFNLAVLNAAGDAASKQRAKKYYAKALELGAKPDPQLEKLLK
jgi:Flp pilus assembly protein TadD